jgi:hypothetical protein
MDDNGPAFVQTAAPTSLNSTTQEGIESVIRLNRGETGCFSMYYDGDKIESLRSFQITSAFEKNSK